MTKSSFHRLALPLLLCLAALWLRWPTIGEGLPYFYNEDEAHHFNRVVEMVKQGEYNPHYFHKPSLHFYLRMPVVAAAFLWSVSRGRIRSVQEIRTRDKFGLAGYAFTASHPGIVKWCRGLSVVFSVGVVLLAYLLALEVLGSRLAAGAAGILTTLSPELVRHAAVIGVDGPLTFLCLLAVYLAAVALRRFSLLQLVAVGLAAGLAVSTKYNALPAALLPLCVCFGARRFEFSALAAAALTPLIGFIAGSPFILAELPLFLDQFAYEIWHYGVEGHAKASAEPGIQQLLHYGGWLGREALGWSGLVCAALGLFLLLRRRGAAGLSTVYPLLFLLLMCGQRANFTRNMLVLIPFAALWAAAGLESLWLLLERRSAALRPSLLLGALCFAQPLMTVLLAGAAPADTRSAVFDWLLRQPPLEGDTAIEGRLQLPLFQVTHKGRTEPLIKGVSRLALEQNVLEYYLAGYDRLVVGPRALTAAELRAVVLEERFVGAAGEQRIVNSPQVKIFRFRSEDELTPLLGKYWVGQPIPAVEAALNQNLSGEAGAEDYLWLSRRRMRINLKLIPEVAARLSSPQGAVLKLLVMSPWPGQRLQLGLDAPGPEHRFGAEDAGRWLEVEWKLKAAEALVLAQRGSFGLRLRRVHVPRQWGSSPDERRLGLALKRIDLKAASPASNESS